MIVNVTPLCCLYHLIEYLAVTADVFIVCLSHSRKIRGQSVIVCLFNTLFGILELN